MRTDAALLEDLQSYTYSKPRCLGNTVYEDELCIQYQLTSPSGTSYSRWQLEDRMSGIVDRFPQLRGFHLLYETIPAEPTGTSERVTIYFVTGYNWKPEKSSILVVGPNPEDVQIVVMDNPYGQDKEFAVSDKWVNKLMPDWINKGWFPLPSLSWAEAWKIAHDYSGSDYMLFQWQAWMTAIASNKVNNNLNI